MRKNTFVNFLAAISVLLVLSACAAGLQIPVESIEDEGDPGELIHQLDSEVSAARLSQINALSPAFFSKAERSLNIPLEFSRKNGLIS